MAKKLGLGGLFSTNGARDFSGKETAASPSYVALSDTLVVTGYVYLTEALQ